MRTVIHLELKPHSDLRMTRRTARHSGSDLPEGGVAIERVWRSKAGSVEEVEELSPQLQLHSLSWNELFGKRQIDVVYAIAPQAGVEARRIAWLLKPGVSKTARIEHALAGKRGVVGSDATAWIAD